MITQTTTDEKTIFVSIVLIVARSFAESICVANSASVTVLRTSEGACSQLFTKHTTPSSVFEADQDILGLVSEKK